MSPNPTTPGEQSSRPLSVFVSYSHKDEAVKDEIVQSIALLRRAGVVSVWHDRKLIPGSAVDSGIRAELQSADIVVLVVSADFLASDYCFDIEMTAAMKRHADGSACVVPVIARTCDWSAAPFGSLVALPRDGMPIDQWQNRSQALTDVALGLRRVCEHVRSRRA